MKKTVLVFVGLMLVSAAAWAQPAIRDNNGVLNASSYAADVARGSWFVVFGTGMGPAAISVYSGGLPYPTDLSGTSVSFTPAAGGSAVSARMWYTLAGQLAAMLPSTTAAGAYDVRVTYNGQVSAPKRVNVVDRNFGYATQAQNGAGPAQATYGGLDLNRFTTGTIGQWSTRPAKAGDAMVLWGTGLGADTNSDLSGATSGDQTAAGQVKVVVGGIEVTPAYAGRSSGSPGLDQINFSVPANVTPSCFVTLQVKAGGRLSNAGSIAVTDPGKSSCTSSTYSDSQLRRLDQGGTLVMGSLSISKQALSMAIQGVALDSKSESVSGAFYRYGAADVGSVDFSTNQIGACTVIQIFGGTSGQGGTLTALDAGAQLTLNGPNASNKAVPRSTGKTYSATLYDSGFMGFGGSGSPTLAQGNYTIAGTGGADVGAFNATVAFPSDLVWTNQKTIADPISRNTALPIQWTGGGTGVVAITGTAVTTATSAITMFTCRAPASAGSFTVPVSVLQQMPATASDGTSTLSVMTGTNTANGEGTFPVTLTGGGSADQAFFTYSIGTTKSTGWN